MTGEKSKHLHYWQTLRDSITSLAASADYEGVNIVLNMNAITALIETSKCLFNGHNYDFIRDNRNNCNQIESSELISIATIITITVIPVIMRFLKIYQYFADNLFFVNWQFGWLRQKTPLILTRSWTRSKYFIRKAWLIWTSSASKYFSTKSRPNRISTDFSCVLLERRRKRRTNCWLKRIWTLLLC